LLESCLSIDKGDVLYNSIVAEKRQESIGTAFSVGPGNRASSCATLAGQSSITARCNNLSLEIDSGVLTDLHQLCIFRFQCGTQKFLGSHACAKPRQHAPSVEIGFAVALIGLSDVDSQAEEATRISTSRGPTGYKSSTYVGCCSIPAGYPIVGECA
jgi:hypothetical protein